MVLHYEGGIKSFVSYIHQTKHLEVLHPDVIYLKREVGDAVAEVAMQYNDSYNEVILSFANNIHTVDGGTHETAFKNALTKVLNEYNRKHGLMKDSDPRLSGEDVREGLTAIISVKLTNCEFEGQTKGKLGNPEAKPLVEKLVMDCLTDYLEENPAVAKTIFEKSSTAQKAREAARKARELTRKKNNILDSSSLPGKLAGLLRPGCHLYRNLYRGRRLRGRFRQGRTGPAVPGYSSSVGQDAQCGEGSFGAGVR